MSLEVYIDSHLTWSVHIEELRRKLIKQTSILARVIIKETPIPILTTDYCCSMLISNHCLSILALSGVIVVKAIMD